MSTYTGRVVIGGASGFMAKTLIPKYRNAGREVITIGRSGADLTWSDEAGIAAAVDGADLAIGLAGKSVSCRYTDQNRAEIFSSRLETTAALSRAIAAATNPPRLWVNSSTATIYRHAMDRPQTESGGELGSGFSVDVAKQWEHALFHDELPHTRRIAMRTAIVLGDGGVYGTLRSLAKLGLGGANWDGWWPVTKRRIATGTAHYPGSKRGEQHFSWVHIDDVAHFLDFVEEHEELDGPINVTSPNPSDNRTFMRLLRKTRGTPIGPPMPRWMSEIGAMLIRTETELILKSRWVIPETLTSAGFDFTYPHLVDALAASERAASGITAR